MSVRQRLVVVVMVAAIVGGLILAGCSPTVAVTVASGIVFISKEIWMPAGDKSPGRPSAGKRPLDVSPSDEGDEDRVG